MVEVYFHVGLGKTGSKYLQFVFFPALKGINYIHMTRYKKSKEIIKRAGSGKFLVSREFDRQFEKEVEWFSADFPDTGAIMVLRRHDEWILSQYKRFIKNGHRFSFDEFFNLNNTGFFRIEHMLFYEKIKFLESHFTREPLVLLYDELRSNPESFLDKIAAYTGTAYDKEKIRFSKKHASYNEKQLKFIYAVSRYINLIPGDSKLKKYLFVYPVRYPILYLAKYIPDRFVPDVDFMPEKEKLNEVREFFKEDWEKCVEYVKTSNEALLHR
ncbi:hypothetical protein [Desulfurobacterium sp.]|uniref:hypothetical protein n=1 Tax=Desulfurobacterium sp. TaxID=2004706 RepID=UPI00261E7083|nr:hypothetical protein [Desulfurobacterium sp.]